ncbi:MAG: hypothetical protein GY822_31360 [Deltaproteobacteria bacterium]|nr:hypothetical protein [Deltaproteobacteria bacterium]
MPIELLLVEHRSETAISLSSYFERCGYLVHTALDLEQAEKFLMSHLVDVVVAACELRNGTGVDLLKLFAPAPQKRPGLVLICHTNKPMAPVEGVHAVIRDPIDLQQLRHAVENIVTSTSVLRPTPTPRSFQDRVNLATPTSDHGIENAPVDLVAKDDVEQDGPHPILNPYEIGRYLLEKSRNRASGVLSIEIEGNTCEVGMVEGVCVGARDTLRENLLGERLRKSGMISDEQLRLTMECVERDGGRIGETLLRQKFIEPVALLDAIEQQAQERLTRAVGMSDGWFVFRADEEAARSLAQAHLDLMQAVLAWFTRAPDDDATDTFIEKNGEFNVFQTDDFEAGLLAYSRVVSQGPLPQFLLMGPRPLLEMIEDLEAQGEDKYQLGGHLFAMALAGMIEPGEEEPELRPKLPVMLPPEEQVTWNKSIVSALCEEWLRVQGRSDYEMLRVPVDSDEADLLTAIAEYRDEFGAVALLGPSLSMAKDLHQRVEIAAKRLLEPQARLVYNTSLIPMPSVQNRSTVTQISEALFLTAKHYLADGSLEKAEEAFANAVEAAPREPDYKAYLGWTHVLRDAKNLKRGVEIIKEAHQMNRTAMRPLFFLGMVAVRTEKLEFARQFLQECARRAPDDGDVKLALQSLKPVESA